MLAVASVDTNYHDTYFVMGSMLLVSRYGGAGGSPYLG